MKVKVSSERANNSYNNSFYIKEFPNLYFLILGSTDLESTEVEKIKSKTNFSDLNKYISEVFNENKKNGRVESLGVIMFKNNIVYFFLFGTKLSLKRKGKIWIFNESGSGVIEESDFLTIGTDIDFINFTVSTSPFVDLRPFVLKFPSISRRRISVSQNLRRDPRKRKVFFMGALIVAIGFVISIFLGFKKIQVDKKMAMYKPKILEAQKNFSEAQALATIDPVRARELAMQAKGAVLGLETDGVKDSDLQKLSSDISNNIGAISHIYEQSSPLYLDLTLVSDGFKISDVSDSEGHMAVLDIDQHKIVTIDQQSKRTQAFAVPLITNPIYLSSYSDQDFVESQDGIWDIAENSSKLLDDNFSSNDLFVTYAGNIYVLSKSSNVIYRYQGVGDGKFAPKNSWFGEGVNPDLSGIIRFVVDGGVWILSGNGKLSQFSQGVPIAFSFTKDSYDFVASDFYTNNESSYLYLLDRGGNRVVVFTKKGEFVAEYHSERIKDTKRIIADETNKRIYLFTGNKIYSLDIKHLN